MRKIIFGTPEKIVPSNFCKGFDYRETEGVYPVDAINCSLNSRGCVLEFPCGAEEQFFGLGLQLKTFNLTGGKFTLHPNADPVAATGDSHAPVPFFVSTAGYGIYIDTARHAEFYFNKKKTLETEYAADDKKTLAVSTEELYKRRAEKGASRVVVQIPVAKGVTIYVIEGKTISDIVSQYNMLAGGGCSVPEWGLGLFYRCCVRYTQTQVEETANYFIKNNIPCEILGLEPGWQTHSYSCSYLWDSQLYPNPQKLLQNLKDKGFHVSLWEHAFVHPSSPIYEKLLPYSGNYEVWGGLVPDFSIREASKIFAQYHKTSVGFGIVDGYKLDECDSSDYTGGWSFPLCSEFPSGMDGEQYHSLFGTLYMQSVLSALDKPTLSEVRNAGALCSPYPFVLYSDLYEHKDFIRGLATAGFSGLLWTPEVRHANDKEEFLRRLQSVVFSPQCLINGWYCDELPWLNFNCENELRYWMDVRNTLKPILIKAFEKYKSEGLPPIRALVSDYTFDSETYQIDDEYIFGENIIVAPIAAGEKSRKVYLPNGEWKNFFTGERVASGWFEVETDSIPVYINENKNEKVPFGK